MRLVLVAVLALAMTACGDLRSGNRLTIDSGIHPAGACPGTDSLTVSIEREGNVAVFLDANSSTPALIIWPVGFAAWLIEGETILYARDGATVLREGGTVVAIGGVAGAPGEPFRVCSVGVRTYS